MLLLFDQKDAYEDMSAEDMQKEIEMHMKWIGELGDQFDSGEALQPDSRSITGGDKVVTDGPFIESKELIGGFYILNANTMEEAVELAKGCPVLELGGRIEVREVMPT